MLELYNLKGDIVQSDPSSYEAIYKYLLTKYNRVTINKKEMAVELGVALSTLDLYMRRGYGVPRYKKLGNKANSRVVFTLVDIAAFLSSGLIETL